MTFSDLRVGQKASMQKTFTAADVTAFAGISLDVNPIHMSDGNAKNTVFGKRIVHGILTSGLISAVLANKLPGPGTIYLGQELKFVAPVYLDDDITAEVEIAELREDKKIVKLNTTCTNQDGKQVITGVATVKFDI
ncbi:MAG: MaoC family dehydratase [Clostridia bacterium]|nr:MaoC family dehydratase [Clostridia bacterium]